MSETSDGRRIYIHKQAFAEVAAREKGAAYRTSHALVGVRLAKIVHHHIVGNGVELGAFRPELAETLVSPTGKHRHQVITNFLGGLTHKPILPWKDMPRQGVLEPGEHIVETCFQDGYYTFATSEAAADRMFADREPMPKLKASIASGNGPTDLTIITNKGRVELAPQFDTHALPAEPASIEDTIHLDTAMRKKYEWGLLAMLEALDEDLGLTDQESRITTSLSVAVKRVFEAPSY
jgi:hypothetical protein